MIFRHGIFRDTLHTLSNQRSDKNLHHETLILPVAEHLDLLSSQFLASASRPTHPSFDTILSNPGRRLKKHTLQSRFQHMVDPYLNDDGVLDPNDYKAAIKDIHTKVVTETVSSLAPNPFLGCPPPPIDKSEKTLPRRCRTLLAQLRSGECHFLNSTLMKYGRSESATCPECKIRRHTMPHLFSCEALPPTSLGVRDLWENPTLVSRFLSTHPSFSQLFPPDPPTPPPPPEPPPG